jgi:hypothetical protein
MKNMMRKILKELESISSRLEMLESENFKPHCVTENIRYRPDIDPISEKKVESDLPTDNLNRRASRYFTPEDAHKCRVAILVGLWKALEAGLQSEWWRRNAKSWAIELWKKSLGHKKYNETQLDKAVSTQFATARSQLLLDNKLRNEYTKRPRGCIYSVEEVAYLLRYAVSTTPRGSIMWKLAYNDALKIHEPNPKWGTTTAIAIRARCHYLAAVCLELADEGFKNEQMTLPYNITLDLIKCDAYLKNLHSDEHARCTGLYNDATRMINLGRALKGDSWKKRNRKKKDRRVSDIVEAILDNCNNNERLKEILKMANEIRQDKKVMATYRESLRRNL